MRSFRFAIPRARPAFVRLPALVSDHGRRAKKAIGVALLSCLPLLPACGRAEPMTFRLVSAGGGALCSSHCAPVIAADGEITDATPDDFRAFLQANAAARGGQIAVFIDSPGGKIVGGIELGKLFRKFGVTASVARINATGGGAAAETAGGICFSACVYALMGAKRRIAPQGSQIGVHRMFAYDGAGRRFDNGAMAAVLRRYCNMMGVRPELIAAAEQGGSDAIRILTPAELVRWRLVSPGS